MLPPKAHAANVNEDAVPQLPVASRRFLTHVDHTLVLVTHMPLASSSSSSSSAAAASDAEGDASALVLREIDVDARTRSLRPDAPISVPMHSPPTSEVIAVERVEDVEFACFRTLVVARARVPMPPPDASASVSRPLKRARRIEKTPSSPETWADIETALTFFLLERGADGDQGAVWRLVPCGAAAVRGAAPESLSVRLVPGPHALVVNESAHALSLYRIHCVETTTTRVLGPWQPLGFHESGASAMETKMRVRGCEWVNGDAATRPHLLLRCQVSITTAAAANSQDSTIPDQWLTIASGPCDADPPPLTVCQPCVYLPEADPLDPITCCRVVSMRPWAEDEAFASAGGLTQLEEQLSTTSTTNANGHNATLPVLWPTSIVLLGTRGGTVALWSHGLRLSTYVVAGEPESISVLDVDPEASRIVFAVQCADAERSWHLLTASPADRRHRIQSLQHFQHTGPCVAGSLLTLDTDIQHLILLNDQLASPHELWLERLLWKAVIVSFRASQPGNTIKTSCHRLKHLAMEEVSSAASSKSRAKKSVRHENLQCIERVRVNNAANDDDPVDDSIGDAGMPEKPIVSAEHLDKLVASFTERLRVGNEQRARLERLCMDKENCLRMLNNHLAQLHGSHDGMGSSFVNMDDEIDLTTVVDLTHPGADLTTECGDHQVIARNRGEVPVSHQLELEGVRVDSFDLSTSTLSMRVALNARNWGSESPTDQESFGISVSITAKESGVTSRSTSESIRWCRQQTKVVAHIEIAIQSVDLREHEATGVHLKATVWMHDLSTNNISMLGVVDVDPFSLTRKSQSNKELSSFGSDEGGVGGSSLLIISGGSSVPRALIDVNSFCGESPPRWSLCRSLFAFGRVASRVEQKGTYLLTRMARSLPADVAVIANPWHRSRVDSSRDLLRAMAHERDELARVLDPTGASPVCLASAQAETDAIASKILADLEHDARLVGIVNSAEDSVGKR